jgi:hypothetical protein
MAKHNEDNRTLLETEEATASARLSDSEGSSRTESWNGAIDVTPYKLAQAWPGEGYCLMGNSFDVELKGPGSPKYFKRAASIRSTLARPRVNTTCISVKDALANVDFVQVLSRFERDWLGRLRTDSLIGPAYDEAGTLIDVAFSVWRRDFTPLSKTTNNH